MDPRRGIKITQPGSGGDRQVRTGGLVEGGPRAFAVRLERVLEDSSPAARLRATTDLLLNVALEEPEFIGAMLECSGKRGQPAAEAGMASVAFRFLLARVSDYMELNRVAATTPEELSVRICAHAHGMVSLYLAGRLPHDEEALRRTYSSSVSHLL